MKCIILFGSHKKLTRNHVRVSFPLQPDYYVRMKIVKAQSVEDALFASKAKHGETLLNTVEVEDSQ